MSASPRLLLLGRDAEATVRVEGDVTAEQVEVFSSVGTVGEPQAIAPGRFQASYTPPKQRFPQLAILAAVARTSTGPTFAWTVLPLWGQGAAEVKTQPGAEVTLRIGERAFGPVVAGADGRARVTVIAPPGVRDVLFGKVRYNLGLPDLPLAHAIVERRAIAGDVQQAVRVHIYEIDPDGAPVARPEIELAASRGTVEKPRLVARGVLETIWTIPPGPPGEVEISGRIPSSEVLAFRHKLAVEAGPAREFSLQLDRERLVAGGSLAVAVQARDLAGNLARARLRAELGPGLSAAMLKQRAPGEYAALLPVPPQLQGRATTELRVFADAEAAVAARTLELAPGPPARIVAEEPAPAIVADGRTPSTLRLEVFDAFGNPSPEPAPAVVFSSLPVRELAPIGTGSWELRLDRVRRVSDGTHTLEVCAGDARLALSRPIQGVRARLAIAGRAGVLTSFNDWVALDTGLQGELWPELLARDLGLRLEAGLALFSRGATDVPGSSGREQMYSLLLGPIWRFVPSEQWRIRYGAEAGAALVHARTWANGGPSLSEQRWMPTVQAAAGIASRVGAGSPFIEVHLAWYDDPRLDNLRGALVGVALDLGYRIEAL